MIETSKDYEELNCSLEQRIVENNKALSDTHDKIQKMEREKMVVAERERFNRDMHDGLGGHLSTALALAELNVGPNASLTQTIRDVADEMRLMLDTVEAMGEDIGMIVGLLRQKLQRQAEPSGYKLIWSIEDTSPIDALNYVAVLNLIRIVQEAVTNAVKHSDGDTVHVSLREINCIIVLEIKDNGRGLRFDLDESGNGTKNMKKRAIELGGKISINNRSEASGLSVALSFPVSDRRL